MLTETTPPNNNKLVSGSCIKYISQTSKQQNFQLSKQYVNCNINLTKMSNISQPQFLSINEQEIIIGRLQTYARLAPLRETVFFSHGDKLSAAALIASGVVFWRAAFRAYNLHKFNKNRLTTLSLTCITAANGSLIHSMTVRDTLTDLYRPENIWSYGIRSLIAHQLGLFTTLLCGVGMTFIFAQRMSIIPVPNQLLKDGVRQLALKYFITKIKPYAKPIGATCLASSIFMFGVGLCEYKQSRDILAKLGRKTLSLREN